MIRARKFVVSWVTVSFFLVAGWIATPLPASVRADSAPTAALPVDSSPDFVAAERSESAHTKKKSILPIVLGIVAAGTVAAVLILVVFNTRTYDIVGDWTLTLTPTGGGAPAKEYDPVTFAGNKKAGTMQIGTFFDGGFSYTVDGKKVAFKSTYFADWTFQGEFQGRDRLSGTSAYHDGDVHWSWTWTAARKASAAATLPAPRSIVGRRVLE